MAIQAMHNDTAFLLDQFRERKQDLQLVQLNTGLRKKHDTSKIVLSCNVANYKDIIKENFFSLHFLN